MRPPHGIEPREGAELRKRDSVCQRSSQGAGAPQRSARAQRGRDSLPRHLELTRTSAKGSFSFMYATAENASRNFDSEWDALSASGRLGNWGPEFGFRVGRAFRFGPVWESTARNYAKLRDALSGWAAGGKRIPFSSGIMGHAFRRLSSVRVRIPARQLEPVCPDIPPTFAPLC